MTERFDGSVFRNQQPIPRKGLWDILVWQLSREGNLWDDYRVEVRSEPPPQRVTGTELRVTMVGHATVLLQTAGLNLLTDPIWSERCSPVSWFGPARAVEPGVAFEQLPPIDAVLISHNHYDHLDLPSLHRLHQEHAPAILMPLGNKALLDQHGIGGGRDLDWWDAVELPGGVRVTSVPAQHFSGRGFWDRDATLWCGYVVESPGGSIYYAGIPASGRTSRRSASASVRPGWRCCRSVRTCRGRS